MAAEGFCSQLPGKHKVQAWKPRTIDDPGPGLRDVIRHAQTLAGTTMLPLAAHADVNVYNSADFIESQGLSMSFTDDSLGSGQRDLVMDRVMIHVFGSRNPVMNDDIDNEIPVSKNHSPRFL